MRRGFTLLETIVALVVISIVSVSVTRVMETIVITDERQNQLEVSEQRSEKVALLLTSYLERSISSTVGQWNNGTCQSQVALDAKRGIILTPYEDQDGLGFFTSHDGLSNVDMMKNFDMMVLRIPSLGFGLTLEKGIVINPLYETGCSEFYINKNSQTFALISGVTQNTISTRTPYISNPYMIANRSLVFELASNGDMEFYPMVRPWLTSHLGEKIIIEKEISSVTVNQLGGRGFKVEVCSYIDGRSEESICSQVRGNYANP